MLRVVEDWKEKLYLEAADFAWFGSTLISYKVNAVLTGEARIPMMSNIIFIFKYSYNKT